MSKRVIALVTDLMFSSNIEATLGGAGYDVEVAESLQGLERALAHGETHAVVLDLHAGVDAEDVVRAAAERPTPVLAFGRHTEPALLRSAREAGCVAAVARSTFVAEMVALVEQAVRSRTQDL